MTAQESGAVVEPVVEPDRAPSRAPDRPGPGLARRLGAELFGTGVLVAAVVGSGILADRLSDDVAVTLLVSAVATVAALGVLIWTLGPVSGAHFNPAVTVVALIRRDLPVREGAGYVTAQLIGAVLGVALANVMFDLPAWETSTQQRDGGAVWLGEVVATAGLLLVIGTLTRTGRGHLGPVLVPAWIGAAYFFTSSTSFANPAVTVGRSLTDTFTGIAPADVPAFIAFQLMGAFVGAALTDLFHPARDRATDTLDLPEPVHD